MPPPTSAGMEAEWCGARNGRTREMRPPSSWPAMEAIIDTSSASAGDSGGSRPGRRAASMDLPDPGGPAISRLWPPAAATSSARLAASWPLMSRRSGTETGASASLGSGGAKVWVPFRWLTSEIKSGAATTSTVPTHAASGPHAAGQIRPRPSSPARSAAGSTPDTGEIEPSSPSSPITQ